MRGTLVAVLMLWLMAFAAGQSDRNNVLILVQPGLPNLFDPPVDPNTVVQNSWVRWPAPQFPADSNRILSIATGVDWKGDPGDFRFERGLGNKWKSLSFDRLKARGHFSLRATVWTADEVVALTNGQGDPSRNSLLLALGPTSPMVPTVGLSGVWPKGKVVVFEAVRADDVRRVMNRTRGRVLVIEYPPPPGQNWGRAWLEGHGWPDGIATDPRLDIPGLISAASVGRFLKAPEAFTWTDPPAAWTGANRWMSLIASARLPLFCVLGIAVLGVGFACAFAVAQERRSVYLAASLRSITLLPAALVLGAAIAFHAGFSGIAVWIVVAWVGLSGAAATVNLIATRAGWNPEMLGYGLVGLIALVAFDPRLSFYSAPLSQGPLVTPPEPLAAMLAAVGIVLGCFRPWRRLTRLVVLTSTGLLIAASFLMPVWWKEGLFPFGFALWLVPAISWSRERGLALLAGFATGVSLILVGVSRGFAFLPNGLIELADQRGAVNLFEWVHAFLSPLVIGVAFFSGALALFGTKFLAYQLRSSWREQPGARILAGSAGWLGVISLVEPPLVEAAIYLLIGAAIVTFEGLLRAAEPIEDD